MKLPVASSLLKLRAARNNKEHLPRLQPAPCRKTYCHVWLPQLYGRKRLL